MKVQSANMQNYLFWDYIALLKKMNWLDDE